LLTDSALMISSFGVDGNGEIYICAFDGKIYGFNQSVIPEFSPIILLVVLLIGTLLGTVFKKNVFQSHTLAFPESK
jgi:hypothetical protein